VFVWRQDTIHVLLVMLLSSSTKLDPTGLMVLELLKVEVMEVELEVDVLIDLLADGRFLQLVIR
jgi:hypothetical protein